MMKVDDFEFLGVLVVADCFGFRHTDGRKESLLPLKQRSMVRSVDNDWLNSVRSFRQVFHQQLWVKKLI